MEPECTCPFRLHGVDDDQHHRACAISKWRKKNDPPLPKLKKGGKSPRRKGDEAERRVVDYFKSIAIPAQRVPCSGSAGGAFRGDVQTFGVYPGTVEVKYRTTSKDWDEWAEYLTLNRAVVLMRPRKEPLVVLMWREFSDLLLMVEPPDDAR